VRDEKKFPKMRGDCATAVRRFGCRRTGLSVDDDERFAVPGDTRRLQGTAFDELAITMRCPSDILLCREAVAPVIIAGCTLGTAEVATAIASKNGYGE